MQKVVFVKQDTQHLNPTTVKIKNSFIKKSKLGQEKTTEQINASNTTTLQSESEPRKGGFNPEEPSMLNFRESQNITSFQCAKEERRSQRTDYFIGSNQTKQYSFVMERNKELQDELNKKSMKIKVLDRRCEDLEMRLLARKNNCSPSNSFSLNNETTKIRLTVSTAEDKKGRIQKLKSIQSRLKEIDFSRALGLGSNSHRDRKRP